MRRMMIVCTRLFEIGHSPFCPALDYHYALMKKEEINFNPHDFYRPTLAWLKVSEYLLVLPKWEKSLGTQEEIRVAREYGIPVFFHLNRLLIFLENPSSPEIEHLWNMWEEK
jgi:hypothetical protein